jgi:hypothetical protein
MSKLLVLGGSLVAILLLALAARLLRLGGARIGDEGDAMAAAEAILSGFEATGAVIGSDGQAALVRGADGSAALLKVHGARIAGRRVSDPQTEVLAEGLRVHSGELRFGAVLLRGVTAP